MNVQFVRLNDEVCESLNNLARESRRTVSDLVNEILSDHLRQIREVPPEEKAK